MQGQEHENKHQLLDLLNHEQGQSVWTVNIKICLVHIKAGHAWKNNSMKLAVNRKTA